MIGGWHGHSGAMSHACVSMSSVSVHGQASSQETHAHASVVPSTQLPLIFFDRRKGATEERGLTEERGPKKGGHY